MSDPRFADDTVDRAAAELLRMPVGDGPSKELMTRTLAALHAADKPDRTLFIRRLAMRTFAAASVAAAVALVVYLANPFEPTVAFAGVARRFHDTHTLSYRYTIQVPGQTDSTNIRTFFREPSLARTEAADGTVTIFDLATGAGLVLKPSAKTAWKMQFPAGGRAVADMANTGGPVELFKKLGEQPNKSLGEKELDGVRVKGFGVEFGAQTLNVWADAKSGNPVRAEMVVHVADKDVSMVMDQFVFDAPLDEKLFRQDVPEGYTLREIKIPELTDASLEHDVAALLKWFANRRGGEFPARLDDWSAMATLTAENKNAESQREDYLIAFRMGRLTSQLARMKKDEHGYAGTGVKLGDASRIVFWYRPAGADKFRALYGDLHTGDVSAEQLPKP